MTDRVEASITIGGTLPADLYAAFAEVIAGEGLSIEWDGSPFLPEHRTEGEALTLFAHEVAWGRFEDLEAWCVAHHLPFARWSGAGNGSFGAERLMSAATVSRSLSPSIMRTAFSAHSRGSSPISRQPPSVSSQSSSRRASARPDPRPIPAGARQGSRQSPHASLAEEVGGIRGRVMPHFLRPGHAAPPLRADFAFGSSVSAP